VGFYTIGGQSLLPQGGPRYPHPFGWVRKVRGVSPSLLIRTVGTARATFLNTKLCPCSERSSIHVSANTGDQATPCNKTTTQQNAKTQKRIKGSSTQYSDRRALYSIPDVTVFVCPAAEEFVRKGLGILTRNVLRLDYRSVICLPGRAYRFTHGRHKVHDDQLNIVFRGGGNPLLEAGKKDPLKSFDY
jgi:hypothetical protein